MIVSTLLELLGLGAIAAGAFLWSTRIGLVVTGVLIVAYGVVIEFATDRGRA